MDQEKIGKFISLKRKEMNLTQKELADKLGVTDKAVSRWERGIGCPDISYLDSLSNILGVSILELLRGEIIENVEINKDVLLESMMYSKEMTKNRIKIVSNTILTTIIIFISLLVIILNVKNIIYLNIEYDNLADVFTVSNNLDKYYDIILNNQGKYTNEEYEEIKKIVNFSKERLNEDVIKYGLKERIKVKDLEEFTHLHSTQTIIEYFENIDIYSILIKYDITKVNNMLGYNNGKYSLLKDFEYIYNIVNNKLDYNIHNKVFLSSFVRGEYEMAEGLLKDIIEVGELDA